MIVAFPRRWHEWGENGGMKPLKRRWHCAPAVDCRNDRVRAI